MSSQILIGVFESWRKYSVMNVVAQWKCVRNRDKGRKGGEKKVRESDRGWACSGGRQCGRGELPRLLQFLSRSLYGVWLFGLWLHVLDSLTSLFKDVKKKTYRQIFFCGWHTDGYVCTLWHWAVRGTKENMICSIKMAALRAVPVVGQQGSIQGPATQLLSFSPLLCM